jgi:hypothetical protein
MRGSTVTNSGLIVTLILLLSCERAVATISAQDVRPRVPDELIELFFKKLCTGGLKCTADEMAIWRSRFRYEVHDLNGDKRPEYFLSINHHDWCGAGSNCGNDVYMKSRRGYRMILHNVRLKVMKTRTKGFLDIESQFRMGVCTRPDAKDGWEIIVTSYKFDGTSYKASKHRQPRCLKRN